MAAIFQRKNAVTRLWKHVEELLTVANSDKKSNLKRGFIGSHEFKIYDVKIELAKYSCGCLGPQNLLRRFTLSVIFHSYFNGFIMFIIILNAVLFAQADYRNVDSTNSLISDGSTRNMLLAVTNVPFLVIFSVECVLMSIGKGLVGPNGYICDPFSWLDIFVVVTGWLSQYGSNDLPNVTAIRSLRVLRVLRGLRLKALPGLGELVDSILKAFKDLGSTALFTIFVLLFLSILASAIFGGPYMHARCRSTPFPVNNSWVNGLDYNEYRCLNVQNFNIPDDEPAWTKASSPWSDPQDCYWPLAVAESPYARYCSFLPNGYHQCKTDDATEDKWCGSEYDAFGNVRFSKWEMKDYISDLNYGFSIYDNTGKAFISLLEVITLAGWTWQAYMLMDAFDMYFAPLFFCIVVLIASYIVLQLFLAVLADSFIEAQTGKENRESVIATEVNDQSSNGVAISDPSILIRALRCLQRHFTWVYQALTVRKTDSELPPWRLLVREIVKSPIFGYISTTMILLNAVVLTMDHYPMETSFSNAIDITNATLTAYFSLEVLLVITAFGIRYYILDSFAMFDLFVVIASLASVIVYPPSLSDGSTTGGSASSTISILRIIRILRMFRLATKFKRFQMTIKIVLSILAGLGNFLILFFMFIFLCTLISLQFFPNVQHYDSNGRVISDIKSDDWYNAAEVARYSFDDFHSAFVTVFQIITADNWNNVSYNLNRALGWPAVIFPVFVVTFGNFIMVNIFLALLLTNYDVIKKKELARIEEEENGEIPMDEEEEIVMPDEFGNDDDIDKFIESPSRRAFFERISRSQDKVAEEASSKLPSVEVANCNSLGSFDDDAQVTAVTNKYSIKRRASVSGDGDLLLDLDGAWLILTKDRNILNYDLLKSFRLELGLSEADELAYCDKHDLEHLIEHLIPDCRATFLEKIGWCFDTDSVGATKGCNNEERKELSSKPSPYQLETPACDFEAAWRLLNQRNKLMDEDAMKTLNEDLCLSSALDLAATTEDDLHILASLLKPLPRRIFLHYTKRPKSVNRNNLKGFSSWKEKEDVTLSFQCPECNSKCADFSAFLGHCCKGPCRRESIIKATFLSESEVLYHNLSRRCSTISLSLQVPGVDHKRPSKWRSIMTEFFESGVYVTSILTLIIISSITLALDSPLYDPNSNFVTVMRIIDIILTSIFSLEALLKIYAYGALSPREIAYFYDAWNAFDFFIVITSILSLFADYSAILRRMRAIRALRALRPLRMLKRIPGLAPLLDAVIKSIPDVLRVFGIFLSILSVFSIIAVSFLKGDLRSCQGSAWNNKISGDKTAVHLLTFPKTWSEMTLKEKFYFSPLSPMMSSTSSCSTYNWPDEPCCLPVTSDVYTSRQICECWGGNWDLVLDQRNFDNFYEAMLSFFQIATNDGWADLMWASVDAAGIDMQPRRDYNQAYCYFYIAFIVLANMLSLNLFIGVLISNVKEEKDKKAGRAALESEHEDWVTTQENVGYLKPLKFTDRPNDDVGAFFHDVCTSKWFNRLIVSLILINSVILALQSFGQSDGMTTFISTTNGAISIIFTLEAIMKICWLRFNYFKITWNCIDFILIAVYDVLMFASIFIESQNVNYVARIFSILRMVKILDKHPRARDIIHALGLALPNLGNLALMLFLLIYVYAVIGVQLFAKIEYDNDYEYHANFRTIPTALFTLFRFATYDNWVPFVNYAKVEVSDCESDPSYDSNYCGFNDVPGCQPLNGCGTWGMYIYAMSFILFVSMCTINLFLGVVIESFVFANDQVKIIKNRDFRRFAKLWAKHDPKATCYILFTELPDFLKNLPPPLGFKGENITRAELMRRIVDLKLHLYFKEKVHIKDLLSALASAAHEQVWKQKDVEADMSKLLKIVEGKVGLKRRNSILGIRVIGHMITSVQVQAAIILQRWIRRYLHRKFGLLTHGYLNSMWFSDDSAFHLSHYGSGITPSTGLLGQSISHSPLQVLTLRSPMDPSLGSFGILTKSLMNEDILCEGRLPNDFTMSRTGIYSGRHGFDLDSMRMSSSYSASDARGLGARMNGAGELFEGASSFGMDLDNSEDDADSSSAPADSSLAEKQKEDSPGTQTQRYSWF